MRVRGADRRFTSLGCCSVKESFSTREGMRCRRFNYYTPRFMFPPSENPHRFICSSRSPLSSPGLHPHRIRREFSGGGAVWCGAGRHHGGNPSKRHVAGVPKCCCFLFPSISFSELFHYSTSPQRVVNFCHIHQSETKCTDQ